MLVRQAARVSPYSRSSSRLQKKRREEWKIPHRLSCGKCGKSGAFFAELFPSLCGYPRALFSTDIHRGGIFHSPPRDLKKSDNGRACFSRCAPSRYESVSPTGSKRLVEEFRAGRSALVRHRILRCRPSRTHYKVCAGLKPSVEWKDALQTMKGGREDNMMELAAYIGLDWADRTHAVCLESVDESILDQFELEQKPEAIHAWVGQLREQFGGRPVGIAIEQTKGALIHALMNYEFIVLYPINPKALARYRAALAVSGAKDDPSDARLLKDFFRKHEAWLDPWIPDDIQTRTIRILSEQRRTAVEDRVRLQHRVQAILKAYFPQALDWAGGLDTVQACDFLLRWSTLTAVRRVRPDTLRKFYYSHRCRSRARIEERIQQIGTPNLSPPTPPL